MQPMRKLIALLFLVSTLITQAQTDEHSYHRAKIYYDSPERFQQLVNIGIPVDHGIHKKNHFFESDFSNEDLNTARSNGYQVEITIENVKSFYLNQNNPRHPLFDDGTSLRNATCSNSGSTTYNTPVNFDVKPGNQFGGYYTYSEILQELNDMATLYPNLITAPADISTFVTEGQPNNSTTPPIGGNTIKWLKISDNPNSSAEGEPQILYTSLHHAREPMSMSQLIFFMWYLLENYDTDTEVQAIVDNTELYFVPVVNPDGYLHNEFTNPSGGGFWRKNRKNGNGVDNNRNYNYHIDGNAANGTWSGPGSSSNPGSDVYHGTAAFSEIENQAMKWFVEQHNFVLALNNHTYGELVYFPFGYADVATPDENVFQGITSEMVSQNGYFPLRDSPFSGDSDDFMYGTVGTHSKIFSMTPEIGSSFWPSAASIEPVCKEMMFFNLSAANLVGNYGTIAETSSNFIGTLSSNVDYTLKRIGLQDPANFTVSINPISANIISAGSTNSHNGLSYGQEVNGSILINLDPNINIGDAISFELVVNNGTYDRSETITKTFGSPIVLLDELGNNTSTYWSTSSWGATTEDFVSASSSITDSPNTNYSNNANAIITLSNEIDLSGALAANLSFQAKWDIENNFDYVQLEVSTNNGSSWIPQCGLYTNDGVANQSGANNEPVYDGFQSDWVQENIDLSDYLGESILIRFRLVSDSSVREDGFYFDDLQINVLEDNLGVDDFIQRQFMIYPNPVNDQLFVKSQIQNYDVSIYSIQGQLIHYLSNQSGNIQVDYSGFASGIYLMTITAEDRTSTLKIIKN